MPMNMVGKLQFLNEYRELETIKPRDREEASAGASVIDYGTGVVSIVFFLAIFFMFTEKNGLLCCFPPDGGIWASEAIVEETAAAEVGEVSALTKTVKSGVA